MQGNPIGEFELSQDLAVSKDEALFIADAWVLKRIWNKEHSVQSNSFQMEATGRLHLL